MYKYKVKEMKLKETNKYENRREGNFKLFLFLSLFPLSQKIESPYSAMQMLVWNNRSLKREFLRIVKRWKGNEFRSRKVAAISILLLLSPTYSTMMMFIKKVALLFDFFATFPSFSLQELTSNFIEESSTLKTRW